MVKTKREFVFATFVTSGLALMASCAALGTPYWASADVILQERYSSVNYGLFNGFYTRIIGSDYGITYELSMTCLISENVCAMLCESTSQARMNTLKKLVKNQATYFGCLNMRRSPAYGGSMLPKLGPGEKDFINAGLWIATIIFLTLSCLTGLGATVLAMWNTIFNPTGVYVNIKGLFVWNCVAAASSLLTTIMWGVLFATTLVRNICIFDTIQNSARSGNAVLHFSYWLNLVAFLLYVASMVTLGVRQHLVEKEAVLKQNVDEQVDRNLLSR